MNKSKKLADQTSPRDVLHTLSEALKQRGGKSISIDLGENAGSAFRNALDAAVHAFDQNERMRAMLLSATTAEALGMVLEERRRQLKDEGFTVERDDALYDAKDHELERAGACYATGEWLLHDKPQYPNAAGIDKPIWPWKAEWWKPTTHKRNLVKAIALLLAALELVLRREKAGA